MWLPSGPGLLFDFGFVRNIWESADWLLRGLYQRVRRAMQLCEESLRSCESQDVSENLCKMWIPIVSSLRPGASRSLGTPSCNWATPKTECHGILQAAHKPSGSSGDCLKVVKSVDACCPSPYL